MYFKPLKENSVNHGFEYKVGLNTYAGEFDNEESETGIYFYRAEHVPSRLWFCTYIAVVEIPSGC